MFSSIAADCGSLLHDESKARKSFNTVRSGSRCSWSPRLHATWSAGSGYTGPSGTGGLWPCARKTALQERSPLEGVGKRAVQLQARWPNFPTDVVDTFRQWGRVLRLRLSHCSQLLLSLLRSTTTNKPGVAFSFPSLAPCPTQQKHCPSKPVQCRSTVQSRTGLTD